MCGTVLSPSVLRHNQHTHLPPCSRRIKTLRAYWWRQFFCCHVLHKATACPFHVTSIITSMATSTVSFQVVVAGTIIAIWRGSFWPSAKSILFYSKQKQSHSLARFFFREWGDERTHILFRLAHLATATTVSLQCILGFPSRPLWMEHFWLVLSFLF